MLGVHRIVEAHAAVRGSEVAVIGTDGVLTFSELNRRANGLARHLIERGLRRGARAVVKMESGPDLALVLLAVLKAGAAYMLVELDESMWPTGISIPRGEEPRALITLDEALAASLRSAPNLPILTRDHDVACVVPPREGHSELLVPHATIAALQSRLRAGAVSWPSESGLLDMWIPLMAGAAVMLTDARSGAAAAA